MADFNENEIVLGVLLNEGGSAKVYRGRNSRNGMMYAVKIIDKNNTPRSTLNQIVNETRIAMSLRHPHVVRTYHSSEDDRYIKIYMELYTGDLLSFINETNDFNSLDVYIVFRQLVSAVNYLHNEKHIVHRDIKLENILFNNGDDINVVLTDFGFSMHRDPTDPLINIYSGTHDYAAPEILQHRPHRGYPADIYALGICLFAMIAKRFPNPREDLYDTFEDDDLADLLRDMLASTEDRRINIKDIINHPWMKKMEEYTESFNDSDQDDPEYYMYRRN